MFFKNRKEFILYGPHINHGYFKLRDFRIKSDSSYSNEDVINFFIKSKYIRWEDNVYLDDRWNFYGIHDASKIVVSDFTQETYENLKQQLLDFIISKSGDGIIRESEPFSVDAKEFAKHLMKDPLGVARNLLRNVQRKIVDYSDEIKIFRKDIEKIMDDYSISGNFYKLNLSEKDKRAKHSLYVYFFSVIM